MISWNVDDEIAEIADRFYHSFKIPDLQDFSEVPLKIKSGKYLFPIDRFQVFSDSLDNLILLIEESRFLSSLAWAYIIDLQDEFAEFTKKQSPVSLGGEVGLLLAAHINYDSSPSILFKNPSTQVSKNRMLGTWFAASLIDSAIIRQFSIIDRIVAILYSILDLELKKTNSETYMPTATMENLNKIKCKLSESDAIEISDILQSEDFANLRLYRDKFIHRKRVETELQGDFYFKLNHLEPQLFRGLPPDDHVARTVYMHQFVVLPLIELAKRNLHRLNLE